MVRIGNHLKIIVAQSLRPKTREFYADLLGCRVLDSPRPDLDLYEFEDGFVLGLFFGPESDALSPNDYLKATWMELKTEDPAALKSRLLAFGVKQVDFPDETRFFFQAPDGQVFRVAPLDGGL